MSTGKVLTADYVLNTVGVKTGVDSASAQFTRLEGNADTPWQVGR